MLIDVCQYLVESVEIVVSWLLVDDPRLFKEIVVDMTTHGVALEIGICKLDQIYLETTAMRVW